MHLKSPKTSFGAALRPQIGDLLVDKGVVSADALAEAVVEAAARGVRLGEHLVGTGLVDAKQVARVVAEQLELDYVEIDVARLDLELAKLLPAEVALRLRVLPAVRLGSRVVIAVSDPTDVLVFDELRMALSMEFDVVVASAAQIEAGLRRLYPGAVAASAGPDEAATSIDILVDESSPAVECVNAILRRAIRLRASDVHFVPRRDDLVVRARVDGVMRDLEVIRADLRTPVTSRLKVMAKLDIAERRIPQDGRVTVTVEHRNLDLRVAVLPTTRGEDIVLRIAYIRTDNCQSMESLGLDPKTASVLRTVLQRPSGAIVVAAPTGAGKTSTLYAALAELHDGTRSIVTIEDPVEYSFDGVAQIEVNPKAGLTFARGLRTILRADPDVILVGEIRDAETGEIVLQAAITGHLVLTTLHAESAAAALVRLGQLGLPESTIGSAVRCVISQRLLRRICRSCSGSGCDICAGSGYDGRTGVFEVLPVSDRIRSCLSHSSEDIRAAAREDGMIELYANALQLVESGVTSIEEVTRVCGPLSP